MPAILALDAVQRRFGSRPVVRAVSLTVHPGSSHLVVGPNGSGKSTLARLAVGLLKPHGGSVRVGGLDPRREPIARARIGYLGHQSLLYGDLTPEENLVFANRVAGRSWAKDAIGARLEQVGIGIERGVPVRRLSRGMVQRVAIARSLLHDPDLVVWDEPLTGLDQASIERTIGLLDAERNRGAATLVISHDLGPLWRPATAVHLLNGGQVVESLDTTTPLEQFRARYGSLFG
ncbi:MAG: ABC transporter ATP-binding protein [Gemmatimonadetes bacterium]|nr:ABC transporter ATP-binding protein [Gemmatimonadota bacterium]